MLESFNTKMRYGKEETVNGRSTSSLVSTCSRRPHVDIRSESVPIPQLQDGDNEKDDEVEEDDDGDKKKKSKKEMGEGDPYSATE